MTRNPPDIATSVQTFIAGGYSCREQIARCTGRTALHLAQVLRMALEALESA